MLSTILHNNVVRGAVSGALAAALIDFNAFRSWKKWSDAMTYDWRTAAFRWAQGAAVGSVTALGVGAVS